MLVHHQATPNRIFLLRPFSQAMVKGGGADGLHVIRKVSNTALTVPFAPQMEQLLVEH